MGGDVFRSTASRCVTASVIALTLISVQVATTGRAQTSAPPSVAGVRRSGNFSPIVASLERSLAFYHGVLGMDVPEGAAEPGPRPYSVNPGLHAMLGTTGAKERHSQARIPGSTMSVEMIEFGEIDRKI